MSKSETTYKVILPCRVEVSDYHEFPFLQDNMRKAIPGIKIFEVACTGMYQGIAYVGRKDAPEVEALIKEIKEEQRMAEEETEYRFQQTGKYK